MTTRQPIAMSATPNGSRGTPRRGSPGACAGAPRAMGGTRSGPNSCRCSQRPAAARALGRSTRSGRPRDVTVCDRASCGDQPYLRRAEISRTCAGTRAGGRRARGYAARRLARRGAPVPRPSTPPVSCVRGPRGTCAWSPRTGRCCALRRKSWFRVWHGWCSTADAPRHPSAARHGLEAECSPVRDLRSAKLEPVPEGLPPFHLPRDRGATSRRERHNCTSSTVFARIPRSLEHTCSLEQNTRVRLNTYGAGRQEAGPLWWITNGAPCRTARGRAGGGLLLVASVSASRDAVRNACSCS